MLKLTIPDRWMSGQHARMRREGDRFRIEDGGSTNGTFVNEARVTTSRQLLPGDLVKIGETELRVEA